MGDCNTELAIFLSGTNSHGALCLPRLDGCEVPERLLALRSQFVRAVAAGGAWSACSTGDGSFFAWASSELPMPVDGAPSGCCAIACGTKQVHVLTDEGAVYMWEYRGDSAMCLPQRVPLPIDVGQLACGEAHALALAEGGIVFSWGRGIEGQLGRPRQPGINCNMTFP